MNQEHISPRIPHGAMHWLHPFLQHQVNPDRMEAAGVQCQ